ncbi:GntR family transcriptional regulator [Aurantimonas sp. MSK8Z-1]|uniref:GntR family transcriptional regulator n=1 Tax=Mangrovibrevibacter kandeliae TaxID=2968473 RepID=UPI00211978E9|nr:GntR family transcriptional regulator [Aurantimonas sp. MSK8Z-1]MCW4115728.1 GntR family transcriptional regulator [Aurantimonas sp. MSK8Z-1]
MTLQPRPKTLARALLDEIRDAILSGDYAAGTLLRQDALAERFGVSRIPVREALLQLDAEGLLTMEPHRGAVVSGVSRAEIEDVFALRGLIEPRLLASSMVHMTGDDLAAAETIHQRYTEAAAAGDKRAYGVLNAQFHMALYARADQPKSRQIVAGLLQTSERYTRMQLSTAAALDRAMEEHARLLALCRSGDVAAATATLWQHIDGVRSDLRAALDEAQDR